MGGPGEGELYKSFKSVRISIDMYLAIERQPVRFKSVGGVLRRRGSRGISPVKIWIARSRAVSLSSLLTYTRYPYTERDRIESANVARTVLRQGHFERRLEQQSIRRGKSPSLFLPSLRWRRPVSLPGRLSPPTHETDFPSASRNGTAPRRRPIAFRA